MQLDSASDANAADLPEAPSSTQQGRAEWEQGQEADMLQMADMLVGDQDRGHPLPLEEQRQLRDDFRQAFRSSLQRGISPTDKALLTWLEQQLNIPHLQYGSDSGADMSEGDAAAATPGPNRGQHQGQQSSRSRRRQRSRQQHRDRQQHPPTPPLRRSERLGAGTHSQPYASVFGPHPQPDNPQQQPGRARRSSTQQASGAGTQPLTPATAHPLQRAGGRARGQQ